MFIGRNGLGSIILLTTFGLTASASSQERTTPKPTPVTADPAPAAVEAAPAPVTTEPAPPQQSDATAPAPQNPKSDPRPKGKAVYTGPTTVIELQPTPILDEEGKQRLDPDGKPMFNDPVKQQRDKHGHPLFDNKNKPVMQTAKDLGYDENGKKIGIKKEKPPKTITVAISHGTLTVDGMIGKAQLNYDIKDLRYIYLYAPWVGTVVISNSSFPGATVQQAAFNDKTLTVTVGDHTFQVFSEKQLLGKKPEAAFVLVDRNFQLPSQLPVMGYGATLKQPYAWPGAKLVASTKTAPPIPTSLRPIALLPPCPAGQMRMPGPPALPGETREDPCVAIAVATKGTTSAAATAPSSPAKPVDAVPPPPKP